ncbi:protein kinase [Toxoplasma gondii FOU]|uniref:Protein kinase n=2 Tax=Toxoplasma gondii TaxID=5811 RepID=A0A086K8I6_TOXGO|nr:protein kinase [Toxoplasma gondii FOU]PUA84474.1 protein kinase [Toxoplasma gondii TgCATBr9]
MCVDYDADKNNLIDFGEFVEALYNVDKEMFLESFEGFDQVDIQLEFDKYAIDDMSPTKKHIPESRVKEMMLDRKFTCVTSLDAKRLFQEMDVNKDGVVDLADFKEKPVSSDDELSTHVEGQLEFSANNEGSIASFLGPFVEANKEENLIIQEGQV